jgi:hypothetical protein
VWALIIAGFVYKPAVSWTIIGILGGIQVMVAFESALENYLNKISGNVVYLEFWLEIYWSMENFLEINKEES